MATVDQRPPRERSLISGMFTEEAKAPGFVVYADCILTRRKRHHMVCDTIDSVLFRSRWWSDIVEWLAAEGISRYTIITDRGRHVVTVSDDSPKEG